MDRVVEQTEPLSVGVHSDVNVGANTSIATCASIELVVVLYRDGDGDGTLDVEVDLPFRASDDTPVADTAVESTEDDGVETTGEITPGFTVLRAVMAVLGLIGLARRRR